MVQTYKLAQDSGVTSVCRNRFLGHIHGAVSDYVVRLETLDPSTAQLKETLTSYRSLQNRLEKMVS